MPQNLIEWAGVLGFGLAVLSLLLQWLLYRHEKRAHAEEAAERVRVDLRFATTVFGPSSPLIATIVNIGRAAVHVDRVELELGPDRPQPDRTITSIPLCASVPPADPGQQRAAALAPGEKLDYFLSPEHPLIPRFAAADRSELRLVVYSHRGEIARVSGDQVGAYLPALGGPSTAPPTPRRP